MAIINATGAWDAYDWLITRISAMEQLAGGYKLSAIIRGPDGRKFSPHTCASAIEISGL